MADNEEPTKTKTKKGNKHMNYEKETIKTVVIAVLVTTVAVLGTLIVAFQAGMRYEADLNNQIKAQASAMVKQLAPTSKQ